MKRAEKWVRFLGRGRLVTLKWKWLHGTYAIPQFPKLQRRQREQSMVFHAPKTGSEAVERVRSGTKEHNGNLQELMTQDQTR